MANWKLGKIQYGFLETATSGGTLTLVNSSKQYQVLTGSSNHTVQLPDATTIGVGKGVTFVISNQSTGIVTVNYNDTTLLATVSAGKSTKLILTDSATANGVWRVVASSGSAGGIASVNPGSYITSNYTVVAGDNGRTLNVDTSSSAIEITLPAPSTNFKVTIKDYKGNANNNNIIIKRAGSELIDFTASDDTMSESYSAYSLTSNGTDWFRVVAFSGVTPAVSGIGLFGGGGGPSDVIDYVTIPTLGNATDFGDLTVARQSPASCSSSTRGLWAGGTGPSNVIDYVTIATAGNATDFGDLTVARSVAAGCSSSVRGLFGGGQNGGNRNEIDYVTIATTGNATDFGDLTQGRYYPGALASPVRALFGGGENGGFIITIDYVTIATTGNAASFGNLTVARESLAGCSSSTRGLFGGGANGGGDSNVIEYVTIASAGNATDFGDLTTSRYGLGATSSSLRALFAGSTAPSNVIDYVTIATTGNATDFGDLTVARGNLAACSNAHGGL